MDVAPGGGCDILPAPEVQSPRREGGEAGEAQGRCFIPFHVHQRLLANYFAKHLNTHNAWAARLLLCELLNLVNVVGNIFLVDAFLGRQFTTYGTDVLRVVGEEAEDRVDPMARCG